ncbi:aspartate-alanine antiporter [Roseomonas nepalensis]|uniref:Aspartate-alanine antiporter n=1 Tax=Muricoccus nepalensis TaxID=1854500 RepID=A0A502FVK5_9PROT|nr:aspartate-alanine antiporter [Roseomonas nepalensis]TPG53420.1 aspartate-alanine antiporter [Roseomonas nepalensis]
MQWITTILQHQPEIAVFIALAAGYWVGGKSWRGFSLGAVTSTLIAAVILGQFDITISSNVRAVFFLIFLFAVGYGVGPQFVRGIAKDGLPQAGFAVVMALLSLGSAWAAARIAGYDAGSAAGLFAGSQTLSASMGLATDAINRSGLPANASKAMLNAMPIAYAVTYIFGTVGSALILAVLGPRLLGIDLPAECKAYEAAMGGKPGPDGVGSAWHDFEFRAFLLRDGDTLAGKSVTAVEASFGDAQVFVERLRRAGKIEEVRSATVLLPGDTIVVASRRNVLVNVLELTEAEVDDPELLSVPVEGVDVYVTNGHFDGKTLSELAHHPAAHGVFLRRITRGATGTDIPMLGGTRIHRGDILTVTGRTQDITAAAKAIGYADRASEASDVAFIGTGIAIGALLGSLSFTVGNVPLTLSSAGGALIAGLVCGWLRSVHPTFGRIPAPAVWFMNSVGLNVFIAVVGISAGPGFVAGLQQLGISLFLWGIAATTVPLVAGIFIGKYVFRFHPAIVLGACAGARTTTAALGMVCEAGKSQVPALGYTVTYAVGNTLLTVWGMVIVMLLQ